jgi:hypothetical protein
LPPRPRLRLSLGGLRLTPSDLRRNGGLARRLLFPRLAFSFGFLLGLVRVRLREMHGQV